MTLLVIPAGDGEPGIYGILVSWPGVVDSGPASRPLTLSTYFSIEAIAACVESIVKYGSNIVLVSLLG